MALIGASAAWALGVWAHRPLRRAKRHSRGASPLVRVRCVSCGLLLAAGEHE